MVVLKEKNRNKSYTRQTSHKITVKPVLVATSIKKQPVLSKHVFSSQNR